MPALSEELQSPKDTLQKFYDVTVKVLNYMPAVISQQTKFRGYNLCVSETAGTIKYVRPIRDELFIFNSSLFSEKFDLFLDILIQLKKGNRKNIEKEYYKIIDSVFYTIQQSIGVGLDLLCNPNSARKHVGNRFEELTRLIIYELGIAHKKIVFKIPYTTEGGEKLYSCETDLIISPFDAVKSDIQNIEPRETVLSVKTTSKDRMGKIFLDKMLMQKFSRHDVSVIGIFLNDVQRATRRDGSQKISYTLVSGLFMVYTEFLVKLDGVYFVDPPPNTTMEPLKNYIFPFSKLIIEDIWKMVS